MRARQMVEPDEDIAQHQVTPRHLMAPTHSETSSIAELLELAGGSLEELGRVWLGYTEPQGSLELRSAIAATYETVSPDQVVVLNSPVEGIYLTMRTLLDAGDEVVVLMPAYDALPNVPEDIGASVRPWFLEETDSGWRLDLDALAALLTNRTRLVVANFPHNPSGYLPTEEEWTAFLEMIGDAGIWLYHDEIFRGLEHGDRPRLDSAADRYEQTVVLGGLSKTHGLPGLRAGWLVVRIDNARRELINTKMYTSICPPAPSQYLILQALRIADQLAADNRELIRTNLALGEEFFAERSELFTFHPPLAGPVALAAIDVPSAVAFCDRLASEGGILLLPAKYLGLGDRHVRFGFGRKSFPEALAAFAEYLDV